MIQKDITISFTGPVGSGKTSLQNLFEDVLKSLPGRIIFKSYSPHKLVVQLKRDIFAK